MEYFEKVVWLNRYQAALRQERVLEMEIERLRSEAERVTPLLSGMPGGKGDNAKMPKAVESILEAVKELENQIVHTQEIRRQVLTAISTEQSQVRREILRRRYLSGQKLTDVADGMRLDYRWVRKLHKKAVQELMLD